MPRDELIETMARAMCRAKWFGIFPVSILNEKVEGFWKMEVVNVIAALTAIEAAGMRVVPVEPTFKMLEAGDWADADGGAKDVWRAMLHAAQEDSTSE